MADVGDQVPSYDAPTTPFQRVVVPADVEPDDTVQMPRIVLPDEPAPDPEPEPEVDDTTTAYVRRPVIRPAAKPAEKPAAKSAAKPSGKAAAKPAEKAAAKPVKPAAMPVERPVEKPGAAVEKSKAAVETVTVPRVSPPRMPMIPPPPKRGISEIPFRVVYMVGAVIATIVALLLIFVVFSGDTPDANPARATSTASLAGASPSELALPPAPEAKAFPAYKGKAAVVIGLVADTKTGIVYPRLGTPWQSKSYAPYTVAQRIGKVARPYTMIVSAKYPIEAPKTKPKDESGYRELAVRAARWSLRTQFPAGSTLGWTGSQPLATGKGWLLGYQVTYGAKSSQAVVAVVEVGKTKPAMMLATVADGRKTQWRDLTTLLKGVRPL
ncbi:hypothetical protein ACIBKY_04045 [Nonomuraea sp. NPDC050394]|uniref:hypothetical protein n=1 Tax=Nonomuraea sp. NPDC050394 TaxID=3364363 RepID=UPI003793B79C